MKQLSFPAALVFTAVAACGGRPAPSHADARTCAAAPPPDARACDPCFDQSTGSSCGVCADGCFQCPAGCAAEPLG